MGAEVLILGSGYISGCLIHFLTQVCTGKGYRITVGSIVESELQLLKSKYDLDTILVDIINQEDLLQSLISSKDIVISLLPNNMHLPVANLCIKEKVSMVHASYCSGDLASEDLDQRAKDAGIIILNEMGLDPGIDHLLAMKCIDEIHEAKGKVTSFKSYCGGLPSPEFKGPLQYKFSWSPRTALGNLLNGAKYLHNKKIIEVPQGGQVLTKTTELSFLPEFSLEGHPNRDSLLYIEKYGIPNCKTIFRGTLRYSGFAKAVKTLLKVGLMGLEPVKILDDKNYGRDSTLTWRELVVHLYLGDRSIGLDDLNKSLGEEDTRVLESLGLLSEKIVDRLDTPLDTLCKVLESTLNFKEGEQDVAILHLEIEAKYPNLEAVGPGGKEYREVDFVVYGDPVGSGYSAMAKTVAYTLGIAAQMIINHEIDRVGVVLPLTKDIYGPILERLADHGLFAFERICSM